MMYLRDQWGYRSSTEVVTDYGRADIMSFNGKHVIEVEIKIDKKDLVEDIKKKKHEWIKQAGRHKGRLPNKLYYCVPTFLLAYAKKYFRGSQYGIILYDRNKIMFEKVYKGKDGFWYKNAPGRKPHHRLKDESISIVRRAKKITDQYPKKLEGYVVESLSNKLYKRYSELHYDEYMRVAKEVEDLLNW